MNKKNTFKKIHFVGIGGIGMSALARYYLNEGSIISGSDGEDSQILKDLNKEGVSVFVGHNQDNVPEDIDLLVYTVAIPSDNEELLKGLELENKNICKVLTYAQALGEMSKEKKIIAVCGTHGKTTTTAMAFNALKRAGLDISMILGSLIDYEGRKTNYVHGSSDWMIIEACEYKRSFMNYNPEIVLVTNIEEDHLDYYKDLQDIENAFQDFINKLPITGKVILHQNEFDRLNSDQKILADDIPLEDIDLGVVGIHNRKNAQLVIKLGQILDLEDKKIREGLKSFTSTWRRSEYKGNFFDMDCYDDYAHHPSEIKATLQGFREKFKDKKIIVAFMPHLYTRTKLFFNDFTESFYDADEVVLLPIYAARESFDSSINSGMIVKELQNKNVKALELASIKDLKDFMSKNSDKNSIFITMGAGDIYKVYE